MHCACVRADVHAAQEARVHIPHGVLRGHRDRAVDRPDHLQDTPSLYLPPGLPVRTQLLCLSARLRSHVTAVSSAHVQCGCRSHFAETTRRARSRCSSRRSSPRSSATCRSPRRASARSHSCAPHSPTTLSYSHVSSVSASLLHKCAMRLFSCAQVVLVDPGDAVLDANLGVRRGAQIHAASRREDRFRLSRDLLLSCCLCRLRDALCALPTTLPLLEFPSPISPDCMQFIPTCELRTRLYTVLAPSIQNQANYIRHSYETNCM